MCNLPKITIAMAVYKPNLSFFKQQLKSIDEQDYKNMELLIWNDSPNDFDCKEIVSQYITQVPYRIIDNGKNNGVTQAFEQLTIASAGKYIAYCDQDDIWMPNKVSVTVDFLEAHPECSCCHCECQLINDNNYVMKSKFYPAEINVINDVNYQKNTFLIKSWGLGCAMTMPSVVAKSALPFPEMVLHDQWLEMYALTKGKFYFIPEVLLKHRIHGTNNSQTLHGVETKSDYYKIKLGREKSFFDFLRKRLPYWNEYKDEGNWINARVKYANNPSFSTFCALLYLFKVRPSVTLFELLIPFIPEVLFSGTLKLIRKEVRKFGVR